MWCGHGGVDTVKLGIRHDVTTAFDAPSFLTISSTGLQISLLTTDVFCRNQQKAHVWVSILYFSNCFTAT